MKNLLQKIITYEPKKRITFKKLFKHKFFKNNILKIIKKLFSIKINELINESKCKYFC